MICFVLGFLLSLSPFDIPALPIPKSLDSLQLFLQTQPHDTLYAQAMKDCAFLYILKGQYSKADSLQNRLQVLNNALHCYRINYYIPFLKAGLAYHQNDRTGCVRYYLQALHVIQARPGLFKPETLESALMNLAAGYSRMDKPDSVMYYALIAVQVQEQHHFVSASPYQSIGGVLTRYKKYEQALPYYTKALEINTKENYLNGMAITENHVGTLYDLMGKKKEAIAHYQQGLIHAEQTGYLLLQTDLLVNLGLMMVAKKEYKKAEAFFQRGERICRELDNYGALRTNLHNQGELYRSIKDFVKAERYYLEAYEIAKKTEDYDHLYTSQFALAELYKDNDQFEKATQFLLMAAVSKDSIFRANTADKVQELLLTYEAEKKQQQIALLNEQNLVQSLQLSVRRRNEILLITIIVLAAGIGFLAYRRRHLKNQIEMEKVRSSIAADFHDELGANLSSIALYSDLLMKDKRGENTSTTPLLENINQNARQTLSSISDLIWTIKPDNDKLEGTLLRMKEFSIPLMEAKNIAFEFKVEEDLRHSKLHMTLRKIIYLVFKEGINNAIKYSEASCIVVRLYKADRKICLEITDNGNGFDPAVVRKGNGLGNMQKRAAQINAQFNITAQPNEGCQIVLKFDPF